MSDVKTIPAQIELPKIDVYRNKRGMICISQDADEAGLIEVQIVEMDETRALLLAIALVDTVKGE